MTASLKPNEKCIDRNLRVVRTWRRNVPLDQGQEHCGHLGPDYGQNGNASKYPVDHEFLVYSRVLIQDDVLKQKLPAFQDSNMNREDYLVSN